MTTKVPSIDVGEEFSPRLVNRDSKQRDGTFTGVDFREKFLKGLDNPGAWKDDSIFVELDFSNVKKMGPSWANEVFAYFTKYAKPNRILKKIRLVKASKVKSSIIQQEIEAGYSSRG